MSITDSINLFVKVIKLLKEYKTQEKITPGEFIDGKLSEENTSEKIEKTYEAFIIIQKHEKFFNKMVENFWEHYRMKSFNKELIETLMYLIIFELDDQNCDNTSNIFIKINYKFAIRVIEYFTSENNLVDTVRAGCKFYDNDYVLKTILHPILRKKKIVERLFEIVDRDLKLKTEVVPKPLTVPVGPSSTSRAKSLPKAPINTPVHEQPTSHCKPLRKSVIEGDHKFQNTLEKARVENKAKAMKLLDFARNNAFKCAKEGPKPVGVEEGPIASAKIKRSRIPVLKNVTVKRNAATLLREAAILAKEKEVEIKRIESLMQTSFDPTTLDELEKNIRECREQQHIQDIEKKHLLGQLTYEDAIIAKQNVIKANQDKQELFQRERLAILEEIDEWRRKEQEKIKLLVQKCQGIENAARDAEMKVKEDKRKRARLIQEETKDLLNEAYVKKQEELANRVKLIQELRALQQVRSLQVKEFDPTESPNLGLLCEMSIAELQERLFLLKLEMKEELERKQKAITETKDKQQKLMENVKQFIDQSRVAKPKPVPRATPKLEQTPEIISLQDRLKRARRARIKLQQEVVT